jgi:hypothetical protein
LPAASTLLHRLNLPELLLGGVFGLGLGVLCYQDLVLLGAEAVPMLALAYALGAWYALIRRASNLRQVLRRAAIGFLVLGGLRLVLAFQKF